MSLGADEVSLLASPGVMPDANGDVLIEQLIAVRTVVESHGVTVRVALDGEGMSTDGVLDVCSRLAQAGVATVQAGAIRLGTQAPFDWVQAMRSVLPHPILLKWTYPVRSMETVLVCVAMGVDRFDGDPRALLRAARQSARLGPLTVPAPGIDF